MRRTSILAVLTVAAIAWPGGSEGAPATGAVVIPNAPPHPNELVCRREPVVGSLIPKRVCRTRAQIEEERAAAQNQTRDATRETRQYKMQRPTTR